MISFNQPRRYALHYKGVLGKLQGAPYCNGAHSLSKQDNSEKNADTPGLRRFSQDTQGHAPRTLRVNSSSSQWRKSQKSNA